MTRLSYRQILIGEQMVGLLGLNELFDELRAQGHAPEPDLVPLLLEGIKRENSVYLAIQIGEWARRYGTIYIPWEMWEGLRPSSQEFVFYIENVGRFALEFDLPVRRLEL